MKVTKTLLLSILLYLAAMKTYAQNEHCELTFMLWVEQPSIVQSPDYFPDFYSELSDFVTCNAARIRFNKVLIRFIDPGTNFGAAGNPWAPSVSSPFLQDLILKLPAGVEVYALPYIKEPQYPWTWRPGNSITQAIRVIKEWNDIISTIDNTRTIKGIAFDPEGSGIPKEEMICQARQNMTTYGINIKVGMTLAGKAIPDAVNWGQRTDCYKLDESYLQIYNLYTQCIGSGTIYVDGFDPNGNPCMIGSCMPSPTCGSSIYLEALTYADPAKIVFDGNPVYKHTFKGILTSEQMNWHLVSIPAGTAKYVYPMFTVEAMINSDCMYPNTNDPSKCGQVDGFGTWTAANFLRFVDLFSDNIGNMTTLGGENIPKSNYGIFQYAFIPNAWRPCNPDYGCEALPVTWLDFRAVKHKTHVTLLWKTLMENGNDYFTIERSSDGKNFHAIGKVDGQNAIYNVSQYSFEDLSPSNSTSYYRLQQVDLDGTSSYSNTVSVTYDEQWLVSLYPNPSSGIVNVFFNTTEDDVYRLTLFSIDGKILMQPEKNSGEQLFIKEELDISSLPIGMYLLKIETDTHVDILKIEKR